jgi:hypothetical protein
MLIKGNAMSTNNKGLANEYNFPYGSCFQINCVY